ncbi:NfeD family protein [Pararhizobium mangrovi]|uniref:NfeD family protein n=1 Tax=Pararhizobium mangrovi TaxID=2590452 RepID=A0A506U6G4_9HYPH|nr:NfeD family protein [Pararhizobium mangrovi]TPW29963.1 NfeD family protein [Pararhizobium mangrovi]
MIDMLIRQLGPWSWWVLGFVLLIAEVVVPGVFFVWIGAAAIAIGAVSLLHWDSVWWTWQIQFIAFAILAFLAALVGRQVMAGREQDTDEPQLNRRSAGLVGRTTTLTDAIENGRGRIRLDDTYWTVAGPDMPTGTPVTVTAAKDRELTVERSKRASDDAQSAPAQTKP